MPPLIVFLGEGFFLKAGVNTFPPSSPRNYFAIYIFWVLEKVPFLLSPRARMRVDNLPMVFWDDASGQNIALFPPRKCALQAKMFMPAAAAAVMAINKTNFPPDIHVNAHTANLSRVCAVIHWVVCRGHSALKVPHIKELVPVPFCSFQKEHVQFISSVPTT